MNVQTTEMNTPSAMEQRIQNITKFLFSIDIKTLLYPFLGIIVFLFLWHVGASKVDTSLGKFPGPSQVLEQSQVLLEEHAAEQDKAAAFYIRQDERNAKKLAADPNAEIKVRKYTGKETFLDQIITSLKTVLFGFLIASAFAIPVGIVCGLSDGFYKGMNPLIQIFKPVSPLAWLPLITMVVSAVYVSDDPFFEKSFLVSAITVALCCLWPTLINTAVGVASVDKDLINVSRVIKLPALTHVRKIILPASIPMIFTGLRLSLATGWMVLIAAEMLSQNPGLGKFVFGFFLDRLILILQRYVSWDKNAVLR